MTICFAVIVHRTNVAIKCRYIKDGSITETSFDVFNFCQLLSAKEKRTHSRLALHRLKIEQSTMTTNKPQFKRTAKQEDYLKLVKNRFLKQKDYVAKTFEVITNPSIQTNYFDNEKTFEELKGSTCESVEEMLTAFVNSKEEPKDLDFDIISCLKNGNSPDLRGAITTISDIIAKCRKTELLYSSTYVNLTRDMPQMNSVFIKMYTKGKEEHYVFYDYTQVKKSGRITVMAHTNLPGIYTMVKNYISQLDRFDCKRNSLNCFFLLKHKQSVKTAKKNTDTPPEFVRFQNDLYPNIQMLETHLSA